MTECFFDFQESDDEKFCEFLELFTREICLNKNSLLEAVVSGRPADEKRMRIKIQIKDEKQRRYSVSTGSKFSDYANFSYFMYLLICECQCSGITPKIYSHRNGFQIIYGVDK